MLAASAATMYPRNMWRLLDAVKMQSKQTQSDVLRAVSPMLSPQERLMWPRSRRQIDTKLVKELGSFHSRVTHRVDIDLTHYDLPGLEKPITFMFIDPVFAWANCATRLSYTHALHFKHSPLYHPVSGELLYGASVAHGNIMRQACERFPPG